MKNKILILTFIALLGLFSYFAFAGVGKEAHGFEFGTGGINENESSGVYIYVKNNFTLLNVTRKNGVTIPSLDVFNSSGSLLARGNFTTGNTANFTLNLTAGQAYRLDANSSVAATTTRCNTTIQGLLPRNGSVIDWMNGTYNGIVGGTGGAFCVIESIDYNNPSALGSTSNSFNSSSYETASESFISNFSLPSSSVSSVSLIYNNTPYSATVSSTETNYTFSSTINVPLTTNSPNSYMWFWNITFTNGTVASTTAFPQINSLINFSLCQTSPQNVRFLNLTFKNETSAQERVSASVPSSSWSYWLGTGTVNKTFSYSTASSNLEYAWCLNPPHKTLKVGTSFRYDNAESEQRTYAPTSALTLTNSTTNTILFLLPTSQGQYVTFQVINPAEQTLSGVSVVVSRSGIGTIETGTTDSSGSVTFFLNPNFEYSFTFSKSGFSDFTTSITPSQTSYTITMGGSTSSETNTTNSARGMSFTVKPTQKTLNNDTSYNFNLTLNSSYWNLDSWGFTLQNRSGFVFVSNSSTADNGGFLSSNINTVKNTTIVMNYFWVINGDYNNATIIWGVIDLSDSGFSISNFFTDFRTYVGLGFFGLDNVGLALITFFAIFIITGTMSYKFGINSPAAIMALIFSLTMFFDIGLGMIPNPIGAIPYAPTFFMFIILVGSIFREMGR